MATVTDKDFLDEARKARLEHPADGRRSRTEKQYAAFYATPRAVIDREMAIVGRGTQRK